MKQMNYPRRRRHEAALALLLSPMLALSPSLGAAQPVEPLPGAQSPALRSNAQVTLNFVNADIDAVTRALSAMLDRQIVVDPRVRGQMTLYSERPLSLREAYQNYLAANKLVCSMSAVGHCGDNAACEGFFGLLKRERVYRSKYPTLAAARADVFEYIERRHNPRMRRRVIRQDQKFSALSKPSVISG